MITVLLFIVILGLLVVVHEWGHFFVARRAGMRVHEFGFGFPPRAFGIYRHPKTKRWVFVRGRGKSGLKDTVGGAERQEEYPATLYSFNWLPLGGFVKIKGENGEEAGDADSFGYHKAWKRLAVLVAGVAMNVVLAAVLLAVGFGIGLPADFGSGVDPAAIVVEPASIVIQQVVSGSPGEAVGLQFGDKIIALDGTPATGAAAMTDYVREIGEREIVLSVERHGAVRDVAVTPRSEDGGPALIGLMLADAGVVRYPWYLSLWKGAAAAFYGLVNIFIALWILVSRLLTGQGLAFDVSGPVGIAVIIGQSARLGLNHLLSVSAMISLSLAAINILPIPALDGGRAFFVVLEKVLRRRLPMRYEQLAHTLGFLLLMTLVIVVTYRDVVGLL